MMENLTRDSLEGDSMIQDYQDNLEFSLGKCL